MITALKFADKPNPDDFQVEQVYVNRNTLSSKLLVLAVCKNRFILYRDRLEIKFKKTLEEDEQITVGCFSHDAKTIHLGTKNGKVISYKVDNGNLDGNHF